MSKAAKEILERQMKEQGIPKAIKELQFSTSRKWRFDYAWPDHKLALELDGGAFIKGRHTRGKGFSEDIVKCNTAMLDGWMVLKATSEQVKSGQAVLWLRLFFGYIDLSDEVE